MINIYCDESCHLENDNSNIMVLGSVYCEKRLYKQISKQIKDIKLRNGLDKNFEIKWTKVSPAKINFYKELIEYFVSNPNLKFRCVIAKDKKQLNNDLFNQTYDEWYYKMYYLLLSKVLDPMKEYNVYIDIKDTNGGPKTEKLKNIVNNFLYMFSKSCLKKIQIIKSHESEILQLCDLLIGTVSYKNRFLNSENLRKDNIMSPAKISLCNNLSDLIGRELNRTTPLSEDKFNIFVWEPQKKGKI